MRTIFGIMVIGTIVAATVAMMTGCASYSVVQGRNADLDRKAVQLSATPNGATMAIDLLGAKGYWQAWKAEPVKMTGATLLDAGTAAAAAYGVQKLTSKSESKSPTPAIQNNGGTVIVNTGSGNTSYSTTQTGAAE